MSYQTKIYFLLIFLVIFDAINISLSLGMKYNRISRNKVKKRDDGMEPDPSSNEVGGVKEADDNGKYIGAFNHDCMETFFISPFRKSVKFESDKDIIAEERVRCHWNIFGTEHCIPVLNCKKFKLEPNMNKEEPCENDYLEVTDGSGGLERFCGAEAPKNLTTGRGFRDLYITFQGTNYTSKLANRGFKCIVHCSSLSEISSVQEDKSFKILEDNFEPETNELCTCGRKPPGNRIVGGEDANRGEFPWIVGLVTAGTRRPYCGGTIVNHNHVLTAAHCFKGPYQNRQNFQILANARLLDMTLTQDQENIKAKLSPEELVKQDMEDSAIRFDVKEYFIHPLYVRQTNDYDVALIKLKKPIDFHKYTSIQPICMPNLATYNHTYENVQAVVAGWGLNAANATQTMAILQKLQVTVMPSSECKSYFDERFSRRMLCAGYKEGGKDSCKGDSGGPLIAEKSKQLWQIIGTVSWGDECAKANSPGVYQRVNEVNQWIRYISNMEDAVWCRE